MGSQNTLMDICHAIKSNDIETVKSILLKNPDVAKSGERIQFKLYPKVFPQNIPLWKAKLLGRDKIVQLLIDFGADVNNKCNFRSTIFGVTFLHYMTHAEDNWKEYMKIAEILISNGANVNACCDFTTTQRSPVQMAIENGNVWSAEFLLKNGARLQGGPEWDDNICPMDFVLISPKNKQKEILEVLIRHGMDIKFRDLDGNDHLLMALKVAIRDSEKFDVVEIAKVLLNSGMTVNNTDNHGQTALLLATDFQNAELVNILVEKGADVNSKSNNSSFPLLVATRNGDMDLVDLFLSKGAEVNAKGEKKITSLHVACYNRNEKIINLLIQKSADISAEDELGSTPFFILNHEKYNESDNPCVNIMVKEIAKRKFLDDSSVSGKDIDLIQADSLLLEFYQTYMEELNRMTKTKFHAFYSYDSVLKTKKSDLKKLANLTKNAEFVAKFEENLYAFSNYENELRIIFEEVLLVRDRLLMVESRLESIFSGYFPTVVIRKLTDNLTLEDLPMQPEDF